MKSWNYKKGELSFLIILSIALLLFIWPKSALAGLEEPMIVWAQDTSELYPYYSEWDGSTWPNGTQGPSVDYDMQWIVAKANPVRNEKIMVVVDKHATVPTLYASIWNGSNWSTAKNMGTIETDDYRCFDAAYEFNSGQALVVASVGASLKYWVWDGSSWVIDGESYDPPDTNGNIFWVKLASKPGSNEIAMIISDDNSDVSGAIWDGDANSWGNEQTLDTGGSSYTTEFIAVEYIQRGTNEGKAMFVWGAYTSGQYLESRTWNGSGWDSEYTRVNVGGTIKWVTLKADPNSNKLVFTSVDGSNDLNVVIWDGTAWGSASERDAELYPSGGAGNTRCADAIFESASGHEGHILLVYSDSTCLRYQHYNGSSWNITETSISASYDAYCVQLEQTTGNTILLAIRDVDDDLNTWKWNNSSWTFLKELTTSLENDDSTTNMPFMITTTLQPPGTPDITSLDYNFGSISAPITIYGTNFGYTQGSSTVTFYNGQTASATSWTNTQIVVTVPSGATDGGYVVVDCGSRGSDSTQNIPYSTFDVITQPPTITAIIPGKGSNFGDIDITSVTGTYLSPGLTLKLTKSGQSDITATNVTLSTQTSIKGSGTYDAGATFDITGVAAGDWNVVVTNPDTQSATLTNGFTIQAPAEVANETEIDSLDYNDLQYSNERHLVRDSAGNWYAVFGYGTVYITKSTDGVNWDSPIALAGSGSILGDTGSIDKGVSVDIYRTGNVSNDRLHVAWSYVAGGGASWTGYVRYSRCNDLANYNLAASWSQVDGGTSPRYDTIEQTSACTFCNAGYPDIAVDSQGYPHAAWYVDYGSGGYVEYSTNRTTGADWATHRTIASETLETGYTDVYYGYPSIDTDTNDYIHVSWGQIKTSPGKYYIRYAKSTDWTSFGSKADIITDDNNMIMSSLVVDSNNKIYVVCKEDTDYDLWFAYYNGTSWSETNITNGSIDIESPVLGAKIGTGITDHILLAKVGSGTPYVNGKVIFWKWNGSSWDYETDPDTGNDSTLYVSIEKHSTGTSSTMGYLVYDTNGDKIYFNTMTGLAQPTVVKLKSFTAKDYGGWVLLKWQTGYEVENLGFHLYREGNGERVRLTPEPVAGSALLAGSRTALTAGRHYVWWDFLDVSTQSSPSPQSSYLSTFKYWLEDIDLSGKRTMHGPVVPVLSQEPLPTKIRPELLSELGMRLQEKYEHYWRIQELKEKLKKRPRGRFRPLSHFVQSSRVLENRGGLASLKLGRLSEQERVIQRYLASRSAVKIFVKEEGWYWVSRSELVAAGLNPKVNPRYLQLYVDGREQPIRVIGEKDGRFDPGDAIEFYGAGLDTLSTDTRVYWLIEGSRPGERVRVVHSQGSRLVTSSFLYTVERKDRTIYFSALRNGEEDNFFGSVVYTAEVDQLLNLRHLDPSPPGDALLEVVLQGVTDVSHRVKVLLNEAEVGEVVFGGQSRGLVKLPISQFQLLEGENVVTLFAQGGPMDVSLVDCIRLTYWYTYTADEGVLKCTAQGGEQLSVDGFSSSKIRVIDVTEPNAPIEVFGTVKPQKTGYGILFKVPGVGSRTLIAFTENGIKMPLGVLANQPSSWYGERHGYDLVIISHRDFFGSLQPLKGLRESQGLSVALVDVEDLYDEFSFGSKSPGALKDFLGLAKKQWRKSPRFVLLVGDASFDPRNYLGLGDFDFVPTRLIDTTYMETASDDWFVDMNEDGLPDIAIGRLPVQTAEETSTVVSKIVGYEKSDRMNEVLLVADRKEKDFDFEGATEEVRALLPTHITVRKVFRGDFGSDAEAKKELLMGINEGPLLVNFIGHGSVEVWRGDIFTSGDAEILTNGLRLPLFVNMTCLNGFFQAPYAESLGEALLKAENGGAVAIWTSSGLTEPGGQVMMNKALIRLLFSGRSLTLGEAIGRAKAATSDQDVRKTWILFGDPSQRLTR